MVTRKTVQSVSNSDKQNTDQEGVSYLVTSMKNLPMHVKLALAVLIATYLMMMFLIPSFVISMTIAGVIITSIVIVIQHFLIDND